MKRSRLIVLSLVLCLVAFVMLMMRVGYPYHRPICLGVWVVSWIPLFMSYWKNREYIRTHREKIRKKVRPFRAHIVMALILIIAAYVAWVLVPPEDTYLMAMNDGDLRQQLVDDLDNLILLNTSVDTLLDEAEGRGLLSMRVDDLSPKVRDGIKSRWRDGIMSFYEYELLKSKYRSFHQIDYVTKPALHADTFFAIYAAYVGQYDTCLRFVELVGGNEFIETLLNEEGQGIPPDTFFQMKRRLTHPDVLLRINAGRAYYGLVKDDITADVDLVAKTEDRMKDIYRRLGKNGEMFVDNPLDTFENVSFKGWFPLQKNIALQMSQIRTTERDYFIMPDLLAKCVEQLEPGDIMVQRRNWHMTNIGIPGFWPHAALYIGTLDEMDEYFEGIATLVGRTASEVIAEQFPEIHEGMKITDAKGYPMRVIEAIRPGVVLQSLETSAHCDYMGAIRPVLTKEEKFEGLLNAFKHFGKSYDFNFDFSTDNALVCSELVFKAYQPFEELGLEPQIVSGRLILPPNRLVKLCAESPRLEFVLFIDASEASQSAGLASSDAFLTSWQRPKWDMMQK